MIQKIKNVLIIVLILAVAYFAYDYFTPVPEVDLSEYIKIGSKEYIKLSSKVDTVTVTETIKVPEYIPVPGPEIPVPVPVDVDTAAILKDYYVKRYYEDTIKQYPDSVGGNSVVVKDTVTQNKILSRSVDFNVETKTIKETITVLEPPRTKVFVGPGVNIGPTVGIHGSVLVKNKKDKVFQLQAGFQNIPNTNDIKPYFGGGVYWKIDLRKKRR